MKKWISFIFSCCKKRASDLPETDLSQGLLSAANPSDSPVSDPRQGSDKGDTLLEVELPNRAAPAVVEALAVLVDVTENLQSANPEAQPRRADYSPCFGTGSVSSDDSESDYEEPASSELAEQEGWFLEEEQAKFLKKYNEMKALAHRYTGVPASDEIVKKLLYANENIVRDSSVSLLHWASQRNDVELLSYFGPMLATQVNAQTASGITPLMYAAASCSKQAVELLLGIPGIDLSLKDLKNLTAADYARINKHTDILKMLQHAQMRAQAVTPVYKMLSYSAAQPQENAFNW